MRSITLIAAAALSLSALSIGACSDEHATQIKEGAQAAGGEIKDAAKEISNDPDVKEAGQALKESAKEAGSDLKEGAQDVGADLKVAADKAGDSAREAGAKADSAARDAAADTKKAARDAKEDIKRDTK